MAPERSNEKRPETGGLKLFAIAVILLGFGVPGCNAFFNFLKGVEEVSPFPHKTHVVQEEMECLDCHESSTDTGDPVLPGRDTCELCHEDNAAILDTFFEKQEPRWARAGRQSEEILFAHATHAGEGEQECRVCHARVAEAPAIYSDIRMTMEECVSCHETAVVKNDTCGVCHLEINQDAPPSSHGGSWELQHGQRSRDGGFRTMDRCELCHTEQGCDDCHHSMQPRSHNNLWRLRGHGIIAGIDRNRCEVCHDRDACDQCHSTTRPLNHSASFGGPLNRHCYSCHLPLSASNGCAVCHQDAMGHDLAPALPGDSTHAQATETQCRACHAPPPHPDNGDNCRFCHL